MIVEVRLKDGQLITRYLINLSGFDFSPKESDFHEIARNCAVSEGLVSADEIDQLEFDVRPE